MVIAEANFQNAKIFGTKEDFYFEGWWPKGRGEENDSEFVQIADQDLPCEQTVQLRNGRNHFQEFKNKNG